jgi:hypothetical protein
MCCQMLLPSCAHQNLPHLLAAVPRIDLSSEAEATAEAMQPQLALLSAILSAVHLTARTADAAAPEQWPTQEAQYSPVCAFTR